MKNFKSSTQDRVDRTAADPNAKPKYDNGMDKLAEASISTRRVSFRCGAKEIYWSVEKGSQVCGHRHPDLIAAGVCLMNKGWVEIGVMVPRSRKDGREMTWDGKWVPRYEVPNE